MKATIIIDWDGYDGPGTGELPKAEALILQRGEAGKDSVAGVHSRVRAAVRDAIRGMDRGDSLRVKIDVLPRKGEKAE